MSVLAGLVTIAAALLAWPFSGTTLGDDFSYVKSALDYATTGQIHYNGWAAMTLGWQILWGAAFIRIFGFSFNILRVSMMLLGGITVGLFHTILLRFGIGKRDAFLGALSLSLTPLFLPLSASFMSDVPGLLVVLLCVAMCQRALVASTAKGSVGWLATAFAVNALGGTVRQICWLGALIMVPAAGWLLRRRPGVTRTVVLGWSSTVLFLVLFLHWYSRQPYSVSEKVIPPQLRQLGGLERLSWQLLGCLLYLSLLTWPVGLAWIVAARGVTRRMVVRVVAVVLCSVGVFVFSARHGTLDTTTMPWLTPMLRVQGMGDFTSTGGPPPTLSLGVRAALSVVVVFLCVCSVEQLVASLRSQTFKAAGHEFTGMMYLLLPFSLGALGLMCPRGSVTFIQDRYLLLLLPAVLCGLLRLFEVAHGREMPAYSLALLLPFAAYAIAGLHTMQAGARADLAAVAQLQRHGVARERIAEGFGADEWVEVGMTGHVNAFVAHPAHAFQADVPKWDMPEACLPFDYYLIPHIHPEYLFTQTPGPCGLRTEFAPVPFTAWLPPFHRAAYTVRPAGRRPPPVDGRAQAILSAR